MPINSGKTAVADVIASLKKTSSNSWYPNVLFIGTHEEWWEHIHQIEQEKFTSFIYLFLRVL
jgi:hypothetical protein